MELWEQLSSTSGVLKSKGAKEAARSSDDSVADFVCKEHDTSGETCTIVDSGLKDLKRLLYGTGLLTPMIQSISSALLSDRVPTEWTKKWETGPEKPLVWVRELVRRRISLMKWKSAVLKSSLFDDPLQLRDLFNPLTFINALRQQTARKLGTAIDKVHLSSSWDKDPRKLRKDCPLLCQLSGLLLQGAAFPSGVLREASSDASELTPAPNVFIGFVPEGDEANENEDALPVPLYLSPTRESLLLQLHMPVPNPDEKDRWILAGIALFLNDDE